MAVEARGSTGSEIIGVEVNGEVVESWTLTTSDEIYETRIPTDVTIEQVRVVFLNDGLEGDTDRNVLMWVIEFDGVAYDPTTLESKGVWNGVDCGIGFRNSYVLYCNGWFDLGLAG